MKIKIQKNYSQTIYVFENKEELFKFTKKDIENTDFSNESLEKLKWRILDSKNSNNITIFELMLVLSNYKRILK